MDATQLADLIRRIRDLIAEGDLESALRTLRDALPETVAKYELAFSLLMRYNMAVRERIRGALNFDESELAMGRISSALMELLGGLEPRDFAAADNASRNGHILYKIPPEMLLQHKHRCVVRLAFEEAVLVKNIEISGTVIKPIRISEVMEVEMLDPNESPTFQIRPINSAEQFVEKGDFSEWIFMVRPLIAGEWPLMLRVKVIEVVNGRERQKEIVLEEIIAVNADRATVAAQPPAEFKASPEVFYCAGLGYGIEIAAPSPPPSPATGTYPVPEPIIGAPVSPRSGSRNPALRRAAVALLFMSIVGAGIMALDIGEFRAWYRADRLDTPESYEGYLKKCPTGRHAPQAQERLDRIYWEKIQADDTLSLKSYLEERPQSLYADLARKRLENQRKDARRLAQSADARPPQEKPTAAPSRPEAPAPRPAPKPPAPSPKPKPKPPAPSPKPKPPAPQPTAPTQESPKPRTRKSGFDMVALSGGVFVMGASDGDRDECPHRATVGAFQIGRYEVTQADWRQIMGANPAYHTGCDDCPVEQVSWNDAREFIRRANALLDKNFRLPTEAEWEYAARAGEAHRFSGANELARVGVYHGNAQRVRPVGSRSPNAWGLYDMSGNVWEWCQDTYKPYPNCKGKASDRRIVRGGSWRNRERDCRVSARKSMRPHEKDYATGLRLAHD